MRVYLSNDALQFDIKTYLHAHYQTKDITFTKDKEEPCDFVFSFGEKRAGLMYYEDGEIKYENWLGREHPLIVKRNSAKNPKTVNKQIAKILIYQVAGNAIGRKLPWGILTGVRPTKLVYKLIAKHGRKRQVIAEILHREYMIAKDKVSLLLDIVGFDGEIISQLEEDSVSLYIGIPFCPTKCTYCSFASYPMDKFEDQVKNYLDALEKEITQVNKHVVKGRSISTIYIGGGTPTALNGLQMERLLKMVTETFDLRGTREFTVEAGRPDTITSYKLQLMKQYGVGRISINPQTMNQETLDLIGRAHTVEAIEEKYAMAKKLGFDNINMDLILGLPGESRIHVLHTLEQMWGFKPDSVTVHTLSVKRGSELKDTIENYHMANSDEVEEMVKMSRIQLEMMGLKPYYMYRQKNTLGNFENVGYATEGNHSMYNIIMIEEAQTVIGMGAGAISKFLYHDEEALKIERIENVKHLKDYIERVDEMVDRKKAFEKMI